MVVERYAAFSIGQYGGNPAGVLISNALPSPSTMQCIAAEIGYSETVFAAPEGNEWRVRYFAPAAEIPFCGHATVALGAALAYRFGDGIFSLLLNKDRVTVEGWISGVVAEASLQSPPTHSRPVPSGYLLDCLAMFSWSQAELDPRIPSAIISAGADHLLIGLNSRETLASMTYEFEVGRKLMDAEALATITVAYAAENRIFHVRNPFAAGGVYEDPATGAAAAALGGYLREIGWAHGGEISILQGDDMGMPSRILATISDELGASVRVSGAVRTIY